MIRPNFYSLYKEYFQNISEMSIPNPEFSIFMPGSSKPILIIQEYLTDNPETTILFISTIDCQAYLVEVTASSYNILNHFHMKAPCSSVFYDIMTNKCVLGDIHGSVHRYNYSMKKWGQKVTYKEVKQERPEIQYVYSRKKSIYAWNLNSQIVILDEDRMIFKNRISLDLDITCGQILRNQKLTNYSACISFANNKPPFIFDCDTGVSILKTYNFSKDLHQEFEQQILIIMQNKLFNDQDCLAIGSWIEKQDIRKYYVSIYSIEEEKQFKICQIKIRFQIPLIPISLNLYGKFLSVGMWQYIQILNIQKRNQICTIKNTKHRWGMVLYGQNTEQRQVYRFLISKGFNFWDVQGSSSKMNSLHYKEENILKPKYIVGSN